MKTSTDLAQQIILYYRVLDRTNEAITEHIQYLFNQYEETVKREKEIALLYGDYVTAAEIRKWQIKEKKD